MSETDFLKLKKHDNVETNTEKFDIENYLNGNWDKINKNAKEVNTEISNINSNNTELEKELKEAQEDFYQNSIRGQASGEYIHVEDSSNCRAKIGIGGNQEQETRSGKNLLELMEGTYSDRGITAVVKNGIVTLNGAATGISFVGINLLKNFNLITENAYRLSAFNTEVVGNSSDNLCSLRLNGEVTKETTFNKTNSNKAITGNFLLTYITIRTAQGITYNNFVIKPQLELGNGTDTWEQGGVSPSPDYQSPVKTVGSNMNLIEETFKGYNLNGNGAFEVSSGFNMQIAKVKANVIYTLNTKTNVLGYYNEKPTLTSVTYNKSRTVLPGDANTIVATRDGYIAIRTIDAEKVKCVEGTEVGEYSKHGQGCVKVTKCNKNLINLDEVEWGTYYTEIGSIGTSTNWGISRKKVMGNTQYYLSGNKTANNTACIVLLNKNKEFIKTVNGYTNTHLISTTNDTCFLGISISKNDTNTIMLEQNSTETSYEEHQEQSYIMPVQFEMLEGDYFDFDNEEEVHVWNKLILDGTESITLNSNYNDCTLFELVKSDCYVAADTKKYAKSNYFISGNKDLLASNSGSNMVGLGTSKGRIWINISNSIVGTSDKLNNFKTFLKSKYDEGTPVTIYYKLATPQRLKFTDEQKAVAKELNNARTYKNVTNITTDSKAILDLDYAKDLETLLTSKESEV